MSSHLVVCTLLGLVFVPSCLTRDVEVAFYINDGYTFSRAEQRAIESIVEDAARDAKRLLPTLSRRLIVRVNPGTQVMEAIGSNSSYTLPNVVHWMVDPSHAGGVVAIARDHLRPALFHQFHRLTRAGHSPPVTLMDYVISTGMAVAFERDFGGRTYPWAEYPANVEEWVQELSAQPPNVERNPWLYRHPDGRRWIGLRAGTYLIDRAMRASGKSAADLVLAPTGEILRLANP